MTIDPGLTRWKPVGIGSDQAILSLDFMSFDIFYC